MLNIRSRAIAAVTAAAIALTTVAVSSADAGPRYRSHSRGNAAAASVMLGIIGAVGAYAAAREYRKAQESRYRYYDRGYYGPQRYGYGGPYRYYGY